MASSTERVTKDELVDMLKDYKDNDFVGVIFSAQDGKKVRAIRCLCSTMQRKFARGGDS